MSQEQPPQTADTAIRVFIGLFILGAVLEGWAALHHAEIRLAFEYWGIAVVLALLDYFWVRIRTFLGPRFTQTAINTATDFRWWVGSIILILILLTISPFVEERHLPFSKQTSDSSAEPTEPKSLPEDTAKIHDLQDTIKELQAASEKLKQSEARKSAQQQPAFPSQPPLLTNSDVIAKVISGGESFQRLTRYFSNQLDGSALSIAITAPQENQEISVNITKLIERACTLTNDFARQGWNEAIITKLPPTCMKDMPMYGRCVDSTLATSGFTGKPCPIFLSPDPDNGKNRDTRTLVVPAPQENVIIVHHDVQKPFDDPFFQILKSAFWDYHIEVGNKINDDVKALYHIPDDGYWVEFGSGSLLKNKKQ